MPRFKPVLVVAALTGCLVAVLLVLAARPATAQVPPHIPGTICFTPQFWCWASPGGPPGYQCFCASPYGLVPGILG